ncbi:MAG TPA: hypothetical protein VEH84_13345 [Alphaproteobacteria bacterium]|nr:hypothetical protein [Alphaproteobacteria bacterium]
MTDRPETAIPHPAPPRPSGADLARIRAEAKRLRDAEMGRLLAALWRLPLALLPRPAAPTGIHSLPKR